MHLPFPYKTHYFKAIGNCYISLYHVYFNNFNMVFKNVRHWKTSVEHVRH